MSSLVVRQTTAPDVDALVRLQAGVYPDIPGWKRDVPLQQIERFGEGQLTGAEAIDTESDENAPARRVENETASR